MKKQKDIKKTSNVVVPPESAVFFFFVLNQLFVYQNSVCCSFGIKISLFFHDKTFQLLNTSVALIFLFHKAFNGVQLCVMETGFNKVKTTFSH